MDLKKFGASLMGGGAIEKMIESMLPQFGEKLKRYEENTMPDGYQKIAYVVVHKEGIPLLSIVPLKRDGDKMIMGKPMWSGTITEFLKLNDGK